MRHSWLALLLLALGCMGDVSELASDPDAELDVLGLAEAALESCPSFVATNAQHVLSGRATTRSTYVFFRRVTTYYALGTNENLGTSGATTTTLYQVGAQSYSRSAQLCEAAPSASGGSASSGCGLAPPSSGGGKTIQVGGRARSYVLAIPSSYDRTRPYPLVFGFHGLGSSGSQAQQYFGIAQAAQGRAIFVYPDALSNTSGARAWGISGTSAAADLAFFDALLAQLQQTLCVDSSRIFAAGHSMGGYFSNTLGCARGNVVRAIAPVAGGGPFVTCDNGKVAAWLMAARDDAVVSYTNGEASRNRWLAANHCASSTRAVGPSACVAYDGCDLGHPVHWCLENAGGHSWPSYGGSAIWSFFSGL